MHVELIEYWIRTAVLLITPIAPHFAEHVWSNVLLEPKSVQLASWPTPAQPVDRTILEAGTYMRTITKETTRFVSMYRKSRGIHLDEKIRTHD